MEPIHSNRSAHAKRPLWRNYLFAYLLIGVGFSLIDIGANPAGDRAIEAAGTILFFTGLLVFAAAMSSSIWLVAHGNGRQQ